MKKLILISILAIFLLSSIVIADRQGRLTEYAEYNSIYGAPLCRTGNSPCDTDDILISRGNLAVPEPNQPNTIDNCTDGSSGTYMVDESVESITITELYDNQFNPGDKIRVDAVVYCWGNNTDTINFVYTNSTTNPDWEVKESVTCLESGLQEVSAIFKLDNFEGFHAIRVINQYGNESTITCGSNPYDDNDDVVFRVVSESNIRI
ncbi:MAG: hypothetical protein KAQ83_03425 [Nanoarchaeota archaeon]|nr:hypothetical protein [Nanoarchaeota archaeon]